MAVQYNNRLSWGGGGGGGGGGAVVTNDKCIKAKTIMHNSHL